MGKYLDSIGLSHFMGLIKQALAGKSDTGHTHAAGDVTSGTLAIGRIPTGTTASTVALGNHDHGSLYLKRQPASGELPADSSTTEGYPIVLSDTFANNGVISYMTKANFQTFIGLNSYLPLTGGTLTGNLTISKADAGLTLKCTDTSGQIGQTIPTGSNKRMAGEYMYDKDGRNIYYSEMIKTTADDLYRSFVVARRDAADSATKLNGFYLHINSSGNPTVGFTSGGAAAWQKALSINYVASNGVLQAGSTNGVPGSYIKFATSKYTSAQTQGWSWIKYNTVSDAGFYIYHAWGVVRIANTACTTASGYCYIAPSSGCYYVALPHVARMIQSVRFGTSQGGANFGMTLGSAGSTTDWCSNADNIYNLPVLMMSPVSRAASSNTAGIYYIPVDVWFTSIS